MDIENIKIKMLLKGNPSVKLLKVAPNVRGVLTIKDLNNAYALAQRLRIQDDVQLVEVLWC